MLYVVLENERDAAAKRPDNKPGYALRLERDLDHTCYNPTRLNKLRDIFKLPESSETRRQENRNDFVLKFIEAYK